MFGGVGNPQDKRKLFVVFTNDVAAGPAYSKIFKSWPQSFADDRTGHGFDSGNP